MGAGELILYLDYDVGSCTRKLTAATHRGPYLSRIPGLLPFQHSGPLEQVLELHPSGARHEARYQSPLGRVSTLEQAGKAEEVQGDALNKGICLQ